MLDRSSSLGMGVGVVGMGSLNWERVAWVLLPAYSQVLPSAPAGDTDSDLLV